MKKKMKKFWFLVLTAVLAIGMMTPAAYAAEGGDQQLSGKTVILYTGNLKGDIDVYAGMASAKKDYEAKGADVYLVDAGNYLQGSAYANSTRGAAIYDLMTASGYDVAAMGLYDFSYGDATTGMVYHGNFHRYYTQTMLQDGLSEAITYNVTRDGSITDTLQPREAAPFSVISSNIVPNGEATKGYYSFNTSVTKKKSETAPEIGFVAATDENVEATLQDDTLAGYSVGSINPPEADVLVALDNRKAGDAVAEADVTIAAPTGGEAVCGAYVIDNETKKVEKVNGFNQADYTADATVDALAQEVKGSALESIAKSEVMLNGADRVNWNQESNLGDLVTDALLWYANNKFDGFKKDVPVVAIQNGGNCDQFMYEGDVTETDMLRSLPFSPMGVGILYVTGDQLLQSLEAATAPSTRYGDVKNPGFAQVAGLKYNVDWNAEFDGLETYGSNEFVKPDSVVRVTILDVNGKAFDPEATYAVIADNYLMNGNDTYYLFSSLKTAATEAADGKYINNGNGVKTRDIVTMYVQQELGGTIGKEYAEPQGRILNIKNEDLPEYLKTDIKTLSSKAKLAKSEYVYTGKAIKPAVTISGLTKDKDFKVAYKDNTKIGKATVTVSGIGDNYKGSFTKTFTIKPAKAVVSKVTAGKKKATVKIKAQKGSVKYQIYYKKASASKWTSKKVSKTSVAISKLKTGKKYQFKARAYKIVNGKTYYGAWSKVKSVKIK